MDWHLSDAATSLFCCRQRRSLQGSPLQSELGPVSRMVWLGCRVHRSSFNSAGKILGVDRLLHPIRPCLKMRENTEPSSHDPHSRFFLVDTRPEHHDVAIGIRDVEQDGVLATGVNQSWNARLGTLQALDHFPIERMRIQVNRRDGLKDLGFLGPSQRA